MKNIFFLLGFLVLTTLTAQSVNITYGGNYSIVDSIPQTGISTSVEIFTNLSEEDDLRIVFGLGAGYKSLSKESGRADRDLFTSIFMGFGSGQSTIKGRKTSFSGGLVTTYIPKSKALEVGGWTQINQPLTKRIDVFGRATIYGNVTNVVIREDAVLNVSIGMSIAISR